LSCLWHSSTGFELAGLPENVLISKSRATSIITKLRTRSSIQTACGNLHNLYSCLVDFCSKRTTQKGSPA
jgi:hypothetical protein